MKATLKDWVFKLLRSLAKRRLKQIQPRIVGVTGSAGKTSSKDAIFEVLSRRFTTKRNEGSMNSEYGVALTILDKKSGFSSARKWLSILSQAIAESLRKPEAYEYLVMEMGISEPGNMDSILSVLHPDIMVFLNVKHTHCGKHGFANRKAIFEEKSKAVYATTKQGWVVLNQDDNFVKQLIGQLPMSSITIGETEGADLRATDIKSDAHGLTFTLEYEGNAIPVVVPHVLGRCHTTSILAAIAVGFICGVPWKTIDHALKEFKLPPGRMNPIDGLNGSLIIDSSYNASPDTVAAALEVLGEFRGRKIAALGTMNELGELSDTEHLKAGKLAAQHADMLIAVGAQAMQLAEGAHRAGMSRSMIHTFINSKEAGEFLSGILESHDIILAKGSQDKVRMEHLVKACMKEPEQARKRLVRQEPYWLTHF